MAAPLKLKNLADWDMWLSRVRTHATDLDLWEYIDPAGKRELTAPESIDPIDYKRVSTFNIITRDEDGNKVLIERKKVTQREYNALRAKGSVTDPELMVQERVKPSQLTETERKEWLMDLEWQKDEVEKYERQKASMAKLREKVIEAIDGPLHMHFSNAITLREILVQLKEGLAPQDAPKIDSAYQEWNRLMKLELGLGTNFEHWASEVEACLKLARSCNAGWANDTHIINSQFLAATGKIAPTWSDAAQKGLLDNGTNGTTLESIYRLLASFTAWMRRFKELKLSVFAVVENETTVAAASTPKPTFQGAAEVKDTKIPGQPVVPIRRRDSEHSTNHPNNLRDVFTISGFLLSPSDLSILHSPEIINELLAHGHPSPPTQNSVAKRITALFKIASFLRAWHSNAPFWEALFASNDNRQFWVTRRETVPKTITEITRVYVAGRRAAKMKEKAGHAPAGVAGCSPQISEKDCDVVSRSLKPNKWSDLLTEAVDAYILLCPLQMAKKDQNAIPWRLKRALFAEAFRSEDPEAVFAASWADDMRVKIHRFLTRGCRDVFLLRGVHSNAKTGVVDSKEKHRDATPEQTTQTNGHADNASSKIAESKLGESDDGGVATLESQPVSGKWW